MNGSAEQGGAAKVKTKYPLWKRPTIKLYFVGWSAPRPDAVELIRPTNYTPPSGYEVTPLNSTDFGNLTGLNAPFISHIIEELQYARAMALVQAIEQIRADPDYQAARNAHVRNMMRQMAQARQLPMKPVSEVSSVRQGNKAKPKAKANASGMGQVAEQEKVLVNFNETAWKIQRQFCCSISTHQSQKNSRPCIKVLLRVLSFQGALLQTRHWVECAPPLPRRAKCKNRESNNWKTLNLFNQYLSASGPRGGKKKPGKV